MEMDAAEPERQLGDIKMNEASNDKVKEPPMHRREITLEDGRYMIFYTFGEEPAAEANAGGDQGEDV